jgi:hypothetical protein
MRRVVMVSAERRDRGLAGVPVVWHEESFGLSCESKGEVVPRSARICLHDCRNRSADAQLAAARAQELVGLSPTLADIGNHLLFPLPQEPDERLIASLLVRGRP